MDICIVCDLTENNESVLKLLQDSVGLFYKEVKSLYPSRSIRMAFSGFWYYVNDNI